MITLNAKTEILEDTFDWLSTNITKGEVGTGTTAPTEDDTDLESPISATFKNLTSVDIDSGVVTYTYELDTTEANGYTIAEFGLFDATPNLYARYVFGGQDKTSDNTVIIQSMIWVEIEVI